MVAQRLRWQIVAAFWTILLFPHAGRAQCPNRPNLLGPTGGGGECDSIVVVTPDSALAPARLPNSNGHSAVFTVKNNGANSDTYDLSCSGITPYVVCTGLSATTLTLAAGDSGVVTAFYNVGPSGPASYPLGRAGGCKEASTTGPG